MKNVWSILLIAAFAVIVFGGLASLLSFIDNNNTLSLESQMKVADYTNRANEYSANYSNNLGTTDYQYNPDVNGIDPYLQEGQEQKGLITQIWSGMKTFISIPYLIFTAIPFVDEGVWAPYKAIINGLLLIMLTIVAYLALKNGDAVKPSNG